MEVVDGGAAAEIEEVLAGAAIAGAAPLPAPNVSEGVLDGDPLAEPGATSRRRLALAELDQEALVGVDGDAAAVGAGGAAVAERAGGAGRGREADRAARLEGEADAVRAPDRLALPVQGEGRLGMTNQVAPPRLRPSKGIHLVLRREDVPLDTAACFISDAERERMLFLIPWNDVVIAGTTDADYAGPLDHPRVTSDERSYFLDALNAALGLSLSTSDVVSAWAGLRPLVRAERASTVDLSRNHAVYDFAPRIVGITGGKLTTYRKMAQDAVDHVAPHFDNIGRSRTRSIKLGCGDVGALTDAVGRRAKRLGIQHECIAQLARCYGDRALAVLDVAAESGLTEPLGPGGHLGAEALYCRTLAR